MKKKVVIVGNFHLPCGNAAAVRVGQLARMFKILGYSVSIYGTELDENYNHSEAGIRLLKRDKPDSMLGWVQYNIKLPFLNDFKSDYDEKILLLYNYPSFPTFLSHVFKRKYEYKIISDTTEWYEVSSNNLLFRLIKKTDVILRMRVFNNLSDGLILVSSYMFEYYQKHQNKLIIYPQTDLTISSTSNSKIKKNDTVNFIYFGNPGNKDEMSIIIEAFGKLKAINYKLYIVGLENKKIEEISDSISNIDNIVFYKWLDRESLIKLLSTIDYSLIIRKPSRLNNAGFPMKFSESYSLGLRIITTDFSDVKKFIREEDFLLEEITTDALLNVLNKILKSKNKHLSRYENNDVFSYKNKAKLKQLDNMIIQMKG